jgi:hypothetical protein
LRGQGGNGFPYLVRFLARLGDHLGCALLRFFLCIGLDLSRFFAGGLQDGGSLLLALFCTRIGASSARKSATVCCASASSLRVATSSDSSSANRSADSAAKEVALSQLAN